MEDNKSANYNEYKLEYNHTLRQSEDFNALFKDGKPHAILNGSNKNAYNRIFDFAARAVFIRTKKDKISIIFLIRTNKFKGHDLSKFRVNVGYREYEFKNIFKDFYHVEIPFDTIDISGRSAGVYLMYRDDNGFMFKRKFLSRSGPHDKNTDHELYYSKIRKYDNHSIFVYETWAGYISIAYREINYTDSAKEQKKIKSAYQKYQNDSKEGKNVPSILLFEKFCGKYEESAKYVFERLIDDGVDNVYFVLSEDSKYQNEVPDKYRQNVIDKYSPKHYYEYFNAKAFISTESMNHAIDLTTYNQLTRRRQMLNDYYYFFLQHGVMFAYSIKGRWDFEKGGGFADNSYVVISSETEANHFIEDGKFDREDLIKSGLPKYDHAIQNEDADKILIMPTSRNFEYSVIRDDTENSTYYKFSKNIIESVPDELKDKIVYIPHPLVMNIIGKSDLEKYMPEEFSYDKLLRDTRLLITDYSSISYDAFYRGCNVLFAWMEKEMCLENLGIDLKLNDENAFADIAYDYEELPEMISRNYYGTHSEENIRKYKNIVEFDDNNNTERFVDYIYDTNIFPEKAQEHDMNDADVLGIEDRSYNGKAINLSRIKVSHNGKKLIRGLDYIVKTYNDIEIGTSTVELIGKGIYKGTKTISYEIKKNLADCEIINDDDGVSIFDGKNKLVEQEDYFLEYEEYPSVAVNKIVAKGMGDYLGQNKVFIDLAKK